MALTERNSLKKRKAGVENFVSFFFSLLLLLLIRFEILLFLAAVCVSNRQQGLFDRDLLNGIVVCSNKSTRRVAIASTNRESFYYAEDDLSKKQGRSHTSSSWSDNSRSQQETFVVREHAIDKRMWLQEATWQRNILSGFSHSRYLIYERNSIVLRLLLPLPTLPPFRHGHTTSARSVDNWLLRPPAIKLVTAQKWANHPPIRGHSHRNAAVSSLTPAAGCSRFGSPQPQRKCTAPCTFIYWCCIVVVVASPRRHPYYVAQKYQKLLMKQRISCWNFSDILLESR